MSTDVDKVVSTFKTLYFKKCFKKLDKVVHAFFLSVQETEAEDHNIKASISDPTIPYCSAQTQKT